MQRTAKLAALLAAFIFCGLVVAKPMLVDWNFRAPSLSDPDSISPKTKGDIAYNYTSNQFVGWNGTQWVQFGGASLPQANITGPITGTYNAVSSEDVLLANAGSGNVTINLPVGTTGKFLIIKKVDNQLGSSNVVTINGNGGEQVDGASSTTLNTENETIYIVFDGSNDWRVISRSYPTSWVDAGNISPAATTTAYTKASGITVDKMRWRRDGKDAIINVSYAQNNTTGANAGSGDYKFPVPSGMTIDTSKITPYTTVVGNAAAYRPLNIVGSGAVSGNTDSGEASVSVYDTTNVRVFVTTSSATGALCATSNYNPTLNNVTWNFEYRVPIVGWN